MNQRRRARLLGGKRSQWEDIAWLKLLLAFTAAALIFSIYWIVARSATQPPGPFRSFVLAALPSLFVVPVIYVAGTYLLDRRGLGSGDELAARLAKFVQSPRMQNELSLPSARDIALAKRVTIISPDGSLDWFGFAAGEAEALLLEKASSPSQLRVVMSRPGSIEHATSVAWKSGASLEALRSDAERSAIRRSLTTADLLRPHVLSGGVELRWIELSISRCYLLIEQSGLRRLWTAASDFGSDIHVQSVELGSDAEHAVERLVGAARQHNASEISRLMEETNARLETTSGFEPAAASRRPVKWP